MQRWQKQALSWLTGGIVFAAALAGAAWMGISMAWQEDDLEGGFPVAAHAPQLYPIGVIVKAGAEGKPLFLAPDVQSMRIFHASMQSAGEKAAELAEESGLLRLDGGADVKTIRQDADGLLIEVLSGDAAGQSGWVHRSHLPDGDAD